MAQLDAWKLRCELIGHEADVRSVSSLSNGSLVTTSRDKTVRVWNSNGMRDFTDCKILVGHEYFVACAIELPPCPAHPAGAVLSAGYDRTMSGQTIVDPVINIWEGESIVGVLKGHTLTVCSLAITATGQLVSASWDKTVRVWDLNTRQCTATLKGHEQAVWSVLALENGAILSGSADKTIKLWDNNVCTKTFTGHTDCVRALALMPGLGFVSTGNDASIRLWSLDGDCLMEMKGHDSFVYTLAVLPSGEIVSGSEDKTCRVWRDGQCVLSLPHAGSVWGVAALPNGDIATACSDAMARVFTRDPALLADETTIAQHEEMLAAQKVAAQEVGGVKMSELPGVEALDQPGNKEGATKIVRVNDKAYAYSWNSVESKWDQIGEVVGGPEGGGGGGGGGGQTMLNGKMYDKVFDIEVEEGVTLKCGYNFGQNPYSVAHDFIQDNDLPVDHLDEIARFIDRNANQNVTLGMDAPMTQGADPFTGANNAMYEAPQASRGGGTDAAGADKAITFESQQHIPKRTMVFFETPGKAEAIEKKAAEFNEAVGASMDDGVSDLKMTDAELATFKAMVGIAFGKDNLARPAPETYALLADKLLKWPKAQLFPGLDVLRMLVLNAYAAKYLSGCQGGFNVLVALAGVTAGSAAEVPAPARLMALRLMVNCFRTSDMRAYATQHAQQLLEAAKGSASFSNAQVQLAYGSLLLNMAVHSRDEPSSPINGWDVVRGVISGCAEFLHTEAAGAAGNEDAIFRVLAAVGTIMWEQKDRILLARELGVATAAEKVSKTHASAKVKECAQQVLIIFSPR